MKANELRIGNWVEHNSDWCYRGEEVSQFQWDTSDWYALGECTLFLENIEPIPLTEEWLIRFGFEIHETNHFWFKKGPICISVLGFIELISWDLQTFKGLGIEVKDVHQLQNLYFALTGEELTIKS